MLEKLFGSKTRVKILKLFLIHPLDKYYIRQLSRDLKLQLNSVRRELENLENFGILTSDAKEINSQEESEGKKEPATGQEKKYYRANPNFVLFDEIKALIVKAQILYEKDFVRKLQAIGKIKLLVLTGIFVNNQSSLIDILLVGNINKVKLIKLIKELEVELGKEINFTVFNPQEFKYRRDITDIFLYGILEGRKLIVINEVGLT
ncbi:MAG: winged helix-turn-helix domain-containing protein [bacterium]|nr:winged helix-turn-helix domain-containing protein [bacterium]